MVEEAIVDGMAAGAAPLLPVLEGAFDEKDCAKLYAPVLDGVDAYLLLIECPDGWRGTPWATLPEALLHELPSTAQVPVESRELAIADACDSVLEWCAMILHGAGSGRNKKQAKLLRAWAEKVKAERGPATAAVGLMQTSAIPPAEIRQIPIADLKESPKNPRKYFAKKKLDELAESMRQNGFWSWNPLMGRPHPEGGFEVGAGHRRLRAAKMAALTAIPVAVSAMSDEQFLRVLTFDNSNREDPHPLDEAAGFRFYLDETACKVTDIAAEIGQSKEYVYQRLKYVDLIEPAREAFMDEQISASHAVLIARLQPADQKRALKFCIDRSFHVGAASVRDLENWLDREVHRDVKKACFDAASPDLLTGVPPCTLCPKRAGNSPELFPEVKLANACTDPTCFSRKEEAHIRLQLATRNNDPNPKKASLLQVSTSYLYGHEVPAGALKRDQYQLIEKKSERCEFAKDAIVVVGDNKGQTIAICITKTCKKHHARHGRYKRSSALVAAEKKRKEEIEQKKRAELATRAAIAAKIAVPYGRREMLILAGTFVRTCDEEQIAKAWGVLPEKKKTSWGAVVEQYETGLIRHLEKLPVPELGRAVMEMALDDISGDSLESAGKNFGVPTAKPPAVKVPAKKAIPKAKAPAKKSPAKKAAPKKQAKASKAGK